MTMRSDQDFQQSPTTRSAVTGLCECRFCCSLDILD
jgi:hypothetical protein